MNYLDRLSGIPNIDPSKLTMLPLSAIELNEGQLEGLPANPRSIKKAKFEKLKKNIEAYPEMLAWRSLLVYPHKNNKYIIIGGNMRYRAMVALGHTEAPVFIMPEDTPVERLQAYTILDNNGFGEWDWDLLANEWPEDMLDDWGLDIGTADDGENKEAREDDFDENDGITVRCKPGDVWILGEHRLMCGDSIDLQCVKRLLGGDMASLYLTDPPYNVNYTGCTKEKLTIQNDNMEDSDFRKFLTSAFSVANEVMSPGASFYIWHADLEGYNFRGACRDVGWKVRQCLIWNKNTFTLGRFDYQWKHEPCLYGWKNGASHYFINERNHTTVLDFDKPIRSEEHPTMKPIKLFAHLILNSSKEGDIVFDSFGGSGTTLIACEELNRKARLMELDPHYCDVIISRWESLTRKEAKLEPEK